MPLYQLPQPQTGSGSWVLSTSPTLVTPALGVAGGASLALGGATIGSNALAVTGQAVFSTTVTTGNINATQSSLNGATVGSSGFLGFNGRGVLTSPAAGSVQIGNADAASPVAQTLSAQSVSAGTSNTSGQNWMLKGSLSTGSGTSGDIILQTGGTGAGTTAQNTATTALTIKGATQAVVVASGKVLQLGNAATTGLTAGVLAALTNATIVITDSTGQAYRIPCII